MSSEREGNRWLRHHFHEFVFPAFMAAEKKSSEIGQPFHIKPSPQAPELLPTELKKLWTLCMDMNVPWEFDVRERNLHNGSSKYRESARVHHGILQNTINSAMAALRDEGCDRLFFGGRDVWTFAVLCSRRRIPYLFVPELSRNVSGKPAVKSFLEAIGFTGKELFLDTGFAGSIPRSMQAHWTDRKFKFRLMSQSDVMVGPKDFGWVDQVPGEGKLPKKELPHYKNKPPRQVLRPNQLFPNRAKAREEALETEYLAKYWRAGTTEPIFPDGCPFVGYAPSILAEWKKKTGVRRYSKPRTFPPAPIYWLGLWDGKEAVQVGMADAQLAPGLYEWWLTLPEEKEHVFPDETLPVGERIIQYFSDRQTIQRAALLTSMLWRGIPYWKSAMHREKKKGISVVPGSVAGVHFNQQALANSTTLNGTVHYTTAGQNIYTVPFTTGTHITNFSNTVSNITSPNVVSDPEKIILQQMVMQAAASMAAHQPQNNLYNHNFYSPKKGPPPEVAAALGAVPLLPEHEPTPVQIEPMPIIMLDNELPVITLDEKDVALLGVYHDHT